MNRDRRMAWKIYALKLLVFVLSITSFSCATLSSLGVKSKGQGYPAYSLAPLQIASVSKYVGGISDNLTKHVSREELVFPRVSVYVVKTSLIQSRSFHDSPNIEITRGLLNIMTNGAELACLLSHEIGHKVLHHKGGGYKKEDRSFKERLEGVFLSDEQELAMWSQKREDEADEYGARLCHKAGYDPYALVSFFDHLSHFQEKGLLASLRELAATHKDFRNRSMHLKKYLETSGIQPGDRALCEKEYRQSLAAIKGIRTGDVVNEILPGGASSALQRLGVIEDELKGYEQTKQPIPVVRFIEIMEELRRIAGQYGIDISAIRTTGLSYPLSSAYYVFMKEVLSQDAPVWGEEDEIGQKIEDILTLLRQITVGSMPYVGDAIDLFELIMGADWFTGQELASEERTLSAFALLAGSGKMWREVASGIDETLDSAKLVKRVGKGSVKQARRSVKQVEEVVEAAKGGKVVVIGESMERRVIPYAEKSNAKWYKAWKNKPFDKTLAKKRNKQWIEDKIKDGYTFIDIGIDPDRVTRSEFYKMEKEILNKSSAHVIEIK